MYTTSNRRITKEDLVLGPQRSMCLYTVRYVSSAPHYCLRTLLVCPTALFGRGNDEVPYRDLIICERVFGSDSCARTRAKLG